MVRQDSGGKCSVLMDEAGSVMHKGEREGRTKESQLQKGVN